MSPHSTDNLIMNYGVVFYILGWILKSEAIFLVFPFIVGLIYGENQGFSFLITAGICLVCGVLLNIKKPKKGGLYLKEGFFVVALGWIIMSCFGAQGEEMDRLFGGQMVKFSAFFWRQ